MDLKKIKSFSIVHKSEAQASVLLKWEKRKNKKFFEGRNTRFPISPEMDSLYETRYRRIFPLGALTADFLKEESQNQNRSVEELIESLLPMLSNNQISRLVDYIEYNYLKYRYMWRTSKSEIKIVFLFLMNEFFNQNEIDSYGDFIEQKFDEVYDEKYMQFDLQTNEYTSLIFDSLFLENIEDIKNVFILDTFASKKRTYNHLDFLKTVNKEEMSYIFDNLSAERLNSQTMSAYNNLMLILDSVRREMSGEIDDSFNVISEKDMIAQMFAYLLGKEKEDLSLSKISNYTNVVSGAEKFIIDDNTKRITNRTIMTQTIHLLIKTIYENMDKIKLQDFVTFVGILSQVRVFSDTGTVLNYVNLFEKMIKEKGFDSFWSFAKILVETALYHEGSFPKYPEWEELVLSDYDYDYDDVNCSLIIPMIVNEDYYDKVSHSTSVTSFREKVLSN